MPFEIVRNDITRMEVDAIVNAANHTLLGGGGVDGAIHRAAGPELLEECRTLGGCETGGAKITRGYRLPARYVIHTVGPVWYGGGNGERELLASCYRNSLELADKYGCETVAFPMISAGAYGYPKAEAMEVASGAIMHFLADHDMTVYLVVFGPAEFLAGKKLFREIREYIDDVYAEKHTQSNLQSIRRKMWHADRDAAAMMDIALGESIREEEPAPAKAEALQAAAPKPAMDKAQDLQEMLRQTDEGFSERLLRLIDEKGMTDIQCYKKANVDRKLFSKIRSNPQYKPGRATVYAFAVALELNLRETRDLLRRAGLAMTRSDRFDIIMEYCIRNRQYDILEINEVLFQYDMPLLGSGMN